MRHNYTITNDGIILIPLTASTSELYRQLRNNNKVRKRFFYDKYISREDQNEWFNRYLNKENDLMFSIHLDDKNKRFIGGVALYDIDDVNASAEVGRIIISPDYSGKGYGYKTINSVCSFALRKLKLKKIYLSVYKDNYKAIGLYEKIGFETKYEKSLRDIKYMELLSEQ